MVTRASESATPVTPKAVLTWQPQRDEMVYLSAAKGYRDGGTNAPSEPSTCTGDLLALGLPVDSNGLPIVPGRYQPDSLWSYELGSKGLGPGSTADHQLRAYFFSTVWSKHPAERLSAGLRRRSSPPTKGRS